MWHYFDFKFELSVNISPFSRRNNLALLIKQTQENAKTSLQSFWCMQGHRNSHPVFRIGNGDEAVALYLNTFCAVAHGVPCL